MDESYEGPVEPGVPGQQTDNPVEADAPSGGHDAQPFDERFDPSSLPQELQSAYKQMQGDYTRKTQTLAEQRKEFEAQQQEYDSYRELVTALQEDPQGTLEALQQQLLGDTEDAQDNEYEYDEDIDPRVSQLQQEIEQIKAERQQQEQQAADYQALAQDVAQITELAGRELDQTELEILGKYATRDEHGLLRVLPLYQDLENLFKTRQEKWIAGKRPQATPGIGSQGSEKFDINDREARIKRMAAIMQAEDAA